MNINEIVHGFKLVNQRNINDIDSVMYEFEHIKSGGKVVYIENDDTNCSFAIGFKTLPNDSTGVCHIIEHSTLCGSKKYPLKEPFVNLLKTSVNTFLNAFTASDWTMYPFASQTKKDFDNIMGIYLDAVFNPLSIESDNAFLQEGWHYELKNKDDDLIYKGVVYNEMKGAMSSVDRIASEALTEALYKDTKYRFNSGGDPDIIPSLTYDDYKEFYKSHYNPENALLVLYGKMDVLERLDYINKEYYSLYNKTGKTEIIEAQKPFINLDTVKEYEISENEKLENNTYIGLAYGLGNYKYYEELLAFQILNDTLMSTNESPLKKVLLDKGLGEDIDIMIDDDNIVPSLHIYLDKTEENKKMLFKETFENAVKELVEKGIDKSLLLASINNSEFKIKEMDMGRMPKGIIFSMQIIGDFLYGNDLITHLEYNKYFKKFKEELNNNYFENLLDKYILKSSHNCMVVVKPSKTIGKEKEEKIKKHLKDIKSKMSEQEILDLVKRTNELLEYQNHQDTVEELKCLPTLELSDVSMDVNFLESYPDSVKNLKGIKHIINTNGIAYMSLYFDCSSLSYDELKYASLLSVLYQSIPTKTHSVLELNNISKTYLGDLNFGISTAPLDKDNAKVYLSVNASSLKENTIYISKLINEIINESVFTLKETKQILSQASIAIKQGLISDGMRQAMDESKGIYSADCSYTLEIGAGIRKYKFINELLNDLDIEKLSSKLKEIEEKIFTSSNLIYSISGSDSEIELLKEEVSKLELSDKTFDEVLKPVYKDPDLSCLIIPSGVNYNSMSNNIFDLDEKYSGKLAILTHIIRLEYFWNQIRVKGGAYGSTLAISRTGVISMGSYRDPNVNETYDAFTKIPLFLEYFDPSKDEFKNYIIGAIGQFDQPESTPTSIKTSDICYLCHITKKNRVDFKKEAISVTVDDIRNYKSLFMKFNENSNIYSIGNETKLKEFRFNNTKTL